jgi:hypothetical protein
VKQKKLSVEESRAEHRVFEVSLQVADVLDKSGLSDFEKHGVLETAKLGLIMGVLKGEKNGGL